MATTQKHACPKCGKEHRGFAAVCWRCKREEADNEKRLRICPYCKAENGSTRQSIYHSVCASRVSEISKKATAKVVKAIKSGNIPAIGKETVCVDCGKPAHDYDHRHYSRPLDVVPVCRACNQKRGPALDIHNFYRAEASMKVAA